MSCRSTACLHLILLAILAGGCSKDEPVPLTAGECQEMKEKQLQLMLGELPKEYQSGLEGAKVEVKVDCDKLDRNARMQYECTMSSSSMKEFDRCQVENYKP